MIEIDAVLSQLSQIRPVFSSEADFQHALAWELQRSNEELDVRLEYRPFPTESKALDVLVRGSELVTAIEVKHLTKALDVTIDGERFVLKSHGAYDIASYDCMKDLVRLERFVTGGVADVGLLIVLANDSAHWREPRRDGAAYDDFRLTDGRLVSGTLEWGPSAGPGTKRGREAPLSLVGRYDLHWSDYSHVVSGPAGDFRYLVVDVPRGVPDNEPDMSGTENLAEDGAMPYLQQQVPDVGDVEAASASPPPSDPRSTCCSESHTSTVVEKGLPMRAASGNRSTQSLRLWLRWQTSRKHPEIRGGPSRRTLSRSLRQAVPR